MVAGNTREKGSKTVSQKPVERAGRINDASDMPEIK